MRKPAIYACVVFTVCAMLSVAFARWRALDQARDAQRRFVTAAQHVTESVVERMRLYTFALRGTRGAVLSAGPDQMTRAAYRLYSNSRSPDREFPGMRGVGVSRRVSRADERAFVEAARRKGKPDFAIRQLVPHEGERYVIQYIEPVELNEQAIGLDLASEPNRKEAADAAMLTGLPSLTGPVVLVQATGKQERGFLLLLPIYVSGGTPETEAARRRECLGWAYGALVVDDLLRGLHLGPHALSLRDLREGDGKSFYASAGSDEPAAAGLVKRLRIDMHGRPWEAEIRARPSFVAGLGHRDPWLTCALGIAAAALLAMSTLIYAQSSEGRAQVRAEQARRATIVSTSTDAIIGVNPDGIVVDWNASAERLFGYTNEQAMGQPIDLIVPEGARELALLRAKVLAKQQLGPFDAVRRARDGTLIDVSVTSSPIVTDSGGVLGVAIILRDIRESKRAARKVLELNASLENQVEERTVRLASALRENEALLRTLHLHTVVSVTDASGHILDVNERFCRISGYAREELLGRTHALIHVPEEGDRWSEGLRQLADGQPWRGELCNRTKDGSLYWLDSVIAPFFGEDGAIERYVSIATDITATKLVEQRLRASEAFLDRAGRVAGVGGWEVDLSTRKVVWSAQTRRIHEVDDDYDPGMDEALTFFPAGARTVLKRAIEKAIDEGQGWDLELPFVTGKGRSLWVHLIGTVEKEGERPIRLLGAVQDITDRRASEELLQQINERFSIAADAAGIGVWDYDVANDRLVCDDRMYEMYHAERDNVDPQAMIAQRVHPEDRARVNAAFQMAVAGRQTYEQEFRIVWPDGEIRHVTITGRVSVDEQGAPRRVTGVLLDITERRRSETALRAATHKAQQASLAKSQFLANMSHEIRTPMNAVIGFSYLLARTALTQEQEGLLSKIQAASKSLLTVINDVLDLSKIEAGELVVERVSFDLRELLTTLTDVALVQADAKCIGFTLDLADDVPTALSGDVTRLNQVLTNLLSNAIKFTEKGSVALRVRKLADDAERTTLRFSVHDTGIGIDPDVQPRLFAAFAQADASTTRRFGGTGLGLSIVRRLTELMGGEVGLRSAPGEGSEFWVVLELSRVTHEAALQPEITAVRGAGALRGVRVLVVDDSHVNLEMVKCILEPEGAIVEVRGNGREAIERLSLPPPVDIVLMDVHMPVLDGHGATQRIRTELGLTTLPIVALTAGALTSERERALAAGMTDFLSKPFDTRDLVRVIRRLCAAKIEALADLPANASASSLKAWPVISGIDTREARASLGDDLTLFVSTLERLLSEFDDVLLPRGGEQPLLAHAARMHRLSVSAGMLAAKTLRDLATQAEAACRAADVDAATRLCARIEDELRQLRAHARPLLGKAARRDAEPLQQIGEADAFDVFSGMVLLVQSLRQHDLAAVDQFGRLAPQMRRLLDEDSFLLLRGYVETLQFADAASMLQSRIDEVDMASSQQTA